MDEVDSILRGPLEPDRSHKMVGYFDEIEEESKKVITDPETQELLHRGFEIFRLSSLFSFADANIPDTSRTPMFSVSEFFIHTFMNDLLGDIRNAELTIATLENRLRTLVGLGTLMGYLARALEADGRWPY